MVFLGFEPRDKGYIDVHLLSYDGPHYFVK